MSINKLYNLYLITCNHPTTSYNMTVIMPRNNNPVWVNKIQFSQSADILQFPQTLYGSLVWGMISVSRSMELWNCSTIIKIPITFLSSLYPPNSWEHKINIYLKLYIVLYDIYLSHFIINSFLQL